MNYNLNSFRGGGGKGYKGLRLYSLNSFRGVWSYIGFRF